MNWKKIFFSAAAFSMLASGIALADEEKPAADKQPPQMRQNRGNFRGGMRFRTRRMDPSMMYAMLVRKELAAYQEKPTPENFTILEKALNEAVKNYTEKRRQQLQKELAELDKNQQEQAAKFLKNVKSGEFKLPPKKPGRPRGPHGKRPNAAQN